MARAKRKQQQPISSDEEPNEEDTCKVFPSSYRLATHDVMCGRNKISDNHRGNIRFRALVEKHCIIYVDENTSKVKRKAIVTEIINQVKSKGGYFLKQDSEGGDFQEISLKNIREKIVHSLRDTSLRLLQTMEATTEIRPKKHKNTERPQIEQKVTTPSRSSKTKRNARVADETSLISYQTDSSDMDEKISSYASKHNRQKEFPCQDQDTQLASFHSQNSYQEYIDECRIRRIRPRIPCKPRKKPKVSESPLLQKKLKGRRTKDKKGTLPKRSQLSHNKVTSQHEQSRRSSVCVDPPLALAQDDPRWEVLNFAVAPTTMLAGHGPKIDALASHRQLVLAAMMAEKSTTVPHVTPVAAKRESEVRELSDLQDAFISEDFVEGPSTLFGSSSPHPSLNKCSNPILPSSQSSGDDEEKSPRQKQRVLPLAARSPDAKKERMYDDLTSTVDSNTPEQQTATFKPSHKNQFHLLDEMEDERISCWGDYR